MSVDTIDETQVITPGPLTTKTYAGFTYQDLSNYFGISNQAASGLIELTNKSDVTYSEAVALQGLDPNRFRQGASGPNQGFGDIIWGLSHLAQHPKGSTYHGDFNISQAFERLFTINPQSFTPANLIRDFSAGYTTIVTGGVSLAHPEVNGTPLASSSARSREPGLVDSAIVGANSFGTVRAGDPQIPESFWNKIARIVGGTVSSLATAKVVAGYQTNNALGPGEYGPPAPLTATQSASNLALSGLSGGLKVFGSTALAQGIISLFGNTIGGALVQLLNGNIFGAFNTLSGKTPVSQNTVGSMYATGGSGGAGFGQNPIAVTQSSTMTWLIPVAIIGGVLVILWVWRK